MCGSDTLAMDVSNSSMNVASVTVNATAHGLTCLVPDDAGTALSSAVVVATVRQPLLERDTVEMYTETDRSQKNDSRDNKIISG
jgi:hypothetical protein